ncbi:MAG TPA: MBL fold metallo-hydrolase [Rhodospirillales bacterium]|nr:MBL fold metallo-hydrolase [Rhodospirillales bacterium]
MKYRIIPVTPFQQNCVLIQCEASGKGAVVDPGGDCHLILAAAREEGVELEKILITHGHIDHAGGAADLSEQAGLPIEGPHKDDAFWIDEMEQQALNFGLPSCRTFEPGRWLEDGDVAVVGEIKLDVLHCPGHTPGHVVFFDCESELALVGDVLFKGSIGRADFPRSNHDDLIDSIRQKLWPLGDNVKFISGHGAMSTFGEERRTNPFVGD